MPPRKMQKEQKEQVVYAASKRKAAPFKPPARSQAAPAREPSPMAISSEDEAPSLPQKSTHRSRPASPSATDGPPPLSQSPDQPAIPQPLLVRLLHEHFASKVTKIDKQAMEVLQKYFEVFVRETIARASLQKKEAAEKAEAEGGVAQDIDVGWLELEDLEKVAAGMLLDF